MKIELLENNGMHVYKIFVNRGKIVTWEEYYAARLRDPLNKSYKTFMHLGYHYHVNITTNGQSFNKVLFSFATKHPHYSIYLDNLQYFVKNIPITSAFDDIKFFNKILVIDYNVAHHYLTILNEPALIPKSLRNWTPQDLFNKTNEAFRKSLINEWVDISAPYKNLDLSEDFKELIMTDIMSSFENISYINAAKDNFFSKRWFYNYIINM
jgi:hypothetical protein